MRRPDAILVLVACLLPAVVSGPVFADPFDDAQRAYQEGDYDKAFRLSRTSAEQGNAKAQYILGVFYQQGKGVVQDFDKAAYWYRKAAEQGEAEAQRNLGLLYEKGQGVPADYGEAANWYRKSAEQGDGVAQYNLGGMYFSGRGVPQDSAEAAIWYREAAERGNALAPYNLGVLYGNGEGVPRDYVQSYMWFSIAVSRLPAADTEKRDQAMKYRDNLSYRMTPEQITEAQRLARDWKPKEEKQEKEK